MTASSALPDRLREATSSRHRDLERSPFVRSLIAGRIDRRCYATLLRNLHVIYEVLERALATTASHPAVAAIHEPALQRRPALERDLLDLHGPGWATELTVVPPAHALAAHLEELITHRPERLVAHAYVRYLGDLSGGQLLRGAVRRALALEGTMGVSFYDFGPPARVAELTRRFREGLTRVPDEKGTHLAITDEAVASFDAHGLLFDALAER